MDRLSKTQAALRRMTPAAVFAAAEAESRAWRLTCPGCGWQGSVWEAGGLRYKAASRGKRTLGRCPGCRRLHWMRIAKEAA